ncbi:hypothetical protein EST38_g9043 [Candolleomyces aberdarensis]|uniref:Uncharacterized protein n=1 Tax=Candolleomyces aberdarensis TaxID=2316362 RepID=A0A4Q2DD50_9AGAR|nr:hypothetical protein EST38_g9043 [Candolleomyces aberdarensis]
MSNPPDLTLPQLRQFLQKGNLFIRYKGYTASDDFFHKGDGTELGAGLHDGNLGEFEFKFINGILTGKIFVNTDSGPRVAISVGKDGTLCACECDQGTNFSVGWNGKGHVIFTLHENKELYWTLVDERDRAKIVLMEWKGNHQQAWGFIPNVGN